MAKCRPKTTIERGYQGPSLCELNDPYDRLVVHLDETSVDYIEVRVLHDGTIQVRATGGRLVVQPDVSNQVTLRRERA